VIHTAVHRRPGQEVLGSIQGGAGNPGSLAPYHLSTTQRRGRLYLGVEG
jgi:hypothetical protein